MKMHVPNNYQLQWIWLVLSIVAAMAVVGVTAAYELAILKQYFALVLSSFFLLLLVFSLTKSAIKDLPSLVLLAVKVALAILVGLMILNLVLNGINVYSLHSNPQVIQFCQANQSICILTSSLFFSLKIYRFITLSGLFFFQLIGLLVVFLSFPRLRDIVAKISGDRLLFVAISFSIWLLVFQVLAAFSTSYTHFWQSFQALKDDYADRFTYKEGGIRYYGWIWPYSQFIKRHTPEDAVIAIPPQSNVWKAEGNHAYLRWFLYPRRLVHIPDHEIPQDISYILVAHGECHEGDCGWPKPTIPEAQIEKYILIDRDSQQESEMEGDYVVDQDIERWGIIILK